MTSGLYTIGIAAFLKGDIDLESDAIAAILIDTDEYTVSLSEHETLADIAAAARVSETTLTGKTVTGTTFQCNAMTFSAVTGSNVDALVLFFSADEEENCILIGYWDNATEFPITPDGTDIVITPSASGMFEVS